MLRSLRHELIFTDSVKIPKQSALEDAQEHESEKRNMTVLKWTEGLGLIWRQGVRWHRFERAASRSVRQGILRVLACYEGIMKKGGLCLARLEFLVSSSHLRGFVNRHLYCSDIVAHDSNGPLSVQKEVPHASITTCLAFQVFFFLLTFSTYSWWRLEPPRLVRHLVYNVIQSVVLIPLKARVFLPCLCEIHKNIYFG